MLLFGLQCNSHNLGQVELIWVKQSLFVAWRVLTMLSEKLLDAGEDSVPLGKLPLFFNSYLHTYYLLRIDTTR
jgi:hypothetical protein